MFEQMGATVSWDPGSKTATVSKAGAEVKVTVGKPEVVINGESRPLDVPPMIYQGVVLVPVRGNFGRHGRVRSVGSGPAYRRRAVYPRDAAAEPSATAAAGSSAPATRRHRRLRPSRCLARRSWPAITSSRQASTTSSIRAATVTAATAGTPSAVEVSSASAAFRSC